MTRRLEVELGPPVIEWLTGQGFDVYQEVSAWSGIADIVAVCGAPLAAEDEERQRQRRQIVAVVELKTSLSFELLYQARRWRGVAHQVWVAGRRSAWRCRPRLPRRSRAASSRRGAAPTQKAEVKTCLTILADLPLAS